MNLTTYTEQTRLDINDGERLRDLFDELIQVLTDFETRLDALERR